MKRKITWPSEKGDLLDPMALWGREMSKAEMMALIMAAPDLLDSLNKLCIAMRDDMPRFSERQWPEYTAARAAIARAKPMQKEKP